MTTKATVIINKKTLAGFTLAEVLITLLIIGIIASIVIPALISDTQDAELHTAWRKAYSNIEQATRMIMSDNAGSIAGLCNNYNHDCIKNLYLPFLSYTKSCNVGTTAGICWHNSSTMKWLNGDSIPGYWNNSTLILNDGSLMSFYSEASCPSTVYHNRCGYIVIDVNGFKKPNTVGKDIFFVQLYEKQLRPLGAQGDGGENDCDDDSAPSGNGYGCAAKYLMQ